MLCFFQVSVVLPDTPQVPQPVLDALSFDNEYYKIKNVSAQEFVGKEFIDAFLNKGNRLMVHCTLRDYEFS